MSEISKEEKFQTVEAEAAEESVSEARFKRRVVAFTVGAVVLLAVLIMLMCYQLIKIGVQKNRLNQLKADIAAYEQMYKEGEETIELRRKRLYIERRARELGYHYADDVELA